MKLHVLKLFTSGQNIHGSQNSGETHIIKDSKRHVSGLTIFARTNSTGKSL
jgi:hypothetical protein